MDFEDFLIMEVIMLYRNLITKIVSVVLGLSLVISNTSAIDQSQVYSLLTKSATYKTMSALLIGVMGVRYVVDGLSPVCPKNCSGYQAESGGCSCRDEMVTKDGKVYNNHITCDMHKNPCSHKPGYMNRLFAIAGGSLACYGAYYLGQYIYNEYLTLCASKVAQVMPVTNKAVETIATKATQVTVPAGSLMANAVNKFAQRNS